MFTNRDDALPLIRDRSARLCRSAAPTSRRPQPTTRTLPQKDSPELLAAVWQLLRTRDISRFNPGQRAPLNEMKLQLIASGRTEEQQTAAEFVRECPYEVVAGTDLCSSSCRKVMRSATASAGARSMPSLPCCASSEPRPTRRKCGSTTPTATANRLGSGCCATPAGGPRRPPPRSGRRRAVAGGPSWSRTGCSTTSRSAGDRRHERRRVAACCLCTRGFTAPQKRMCVGKPRQHSQQRQLFLSGQQRQQRQSPLDQ